MADDTPLVLVSNRGPVTFQEGGEVKRGTGGLVTALMGLASHRQVTWVASAMSEEDVKAAEIPEVVDDDALEDRIREIGEEIRRLSPRYLEIAKLSSNVWWNTLRDSYVSGMGMLIQAAGSPDMVEGATAFLEKRAPQFRRPS